MKSGINGMLPLMIVTLCSLPLDQAGTLPRVDNVARVNDEDQLQQRWLDDFDAAPRQEDDSIYDMQADSPSFDAIDVAEVGRGYVADWKKSPVRQSNADDEPDEDAPRCPPPILPAAIIGTWCSAASRVSAAHHCTTDADCQSSISSSTSQRKKKCCHNGCRRVCAVPIDPAPYIDWKREPQTLLTSGKSWLIQGPEEAQEVEWCSTSYAYDDVTTDEEPLLCPSGYTCYIDDPGDVEKGVPNRGRCVPESTGLGSDQKSNFQLASYVSINGACVVSNVTHNNGDTFSYERHTCKCEDGSVLCRVGKKATVRGGAKQ